MPLVTVNPATGETLHRFTEADDARIDQAVARSERSFVAWRELAPTERARHLQRLGAALRRDSDALSALITSEMGKPISQSRAEIEKCALACDYYAQEGPDLLVPTLPPRAPAQSGIAYEPLGPLLAIMPWNFPMWQVFRAAIPALLAGNTVLLKHASNVSGCALAAEEVFRRAGLPRGVFQTLLVGSGRVPALIGDPRIRAVTLTGSVEAGRKVGALAGRALKPCVLELGGSDPYIVLEDADLALAAETCAAARLVNSGQSCVAGKRFIVVDRVRAEFEELFAERVRARRVGDPFDPATDVGPLARADLRETLQKQIRSTLRRGAKRLLGGGPKKGAGFFFEPTVLTDVRKGMPACDDEVFGPVAAVIPVRDEAEALRVANDTRFGLGAAVFTRDLERGEEIARERLAAGMCFVNAFVRSEVSLPFGGVKDSGFGRELGPWGVHSFVNTKTLWIEGSSRTEK
ncbi:succinate-semialdehyde dehydrogenase [Opitutaceae bacterium EW11]|nr:succinate-semialdehyde dehydrogenase [Opitutaceae bacterium EW11]